MSMITDIKVGKAGRLELTKRILEKYGIKEGDRIIVREFGSQIVLIPVTRHDKPTKALHGSVKTEKRIDKPKEKARKYIRKKLTEEFL